jgi:hypothetical protein
MSAHWIDKLEPDDARLAVVQALDISAGDVERAAERLETTRLGLWRTLSRLELLNIPAQMRNRARARMQLAG